MIDDQAEVNKQVARVLQRLRPKPDYRALVVISGAPGTGKVVIGFHILWLYGQLFAEAGQYGAKCVFSLPRSRTLSQVIKGASDIAPVYLDSVASGLDLVVVDEAHRIEKVNERMRALFKKTKIVVVLQDDRQCIGLSEEGTVACFQSFAQGVGIPLEKLRLASQKRADFLGDYVQRLLYERADTTGLPCEGIEITCWQSLFDLDEHLSRLQATGHHVKWYAPFCWAWSKNVTAKDIVIQTEEGLFLKPWNPNDGQYAWYRGVQAEDLNQVGCIYAD